MQAINIKNLMKRYGTHQVLNGVNLSVDAGEFYALMGPNGCGKTTLASVMASVTSFDSGTLEICGKKPDQVRNLIGYIPQDNFSVPQLTGRENLMYFGGLLGYSGKNAWLIVEEILNKIDLLGEANKRVAHYSGGMRKRLEIGTALFPCVRVLILDEPTTGLDPAARRDFFNLIQSIKDKQASIFLISHIGTDAEFASKVGLINRGKIIVEDTPIGLRAAYAPEDVITLETSVRNKRAEDLIRDYSYQRKITEIETGYRIYSRDSDAVVPVVTRTLNNAGFQVIRTEVTKSTLEDVFFKLTEQKMQEAN